MRVMSLAVVFVESVADALVGGSGLAVDAVGVDLEQDGHEVASDGAAGLTGAIEQAFPAALRQRCIIHRARNLLAKIPAGMQAEVKHAYRAIFDTEDLKTPPGPGLEGIIDARIR